MNFFHSLDTTKSGSVITVTDIDVSDNMSTFLSDDTTSYYPLYVDVTDSLNKQFKIVQLEVYRKKISESVFEDILFIHNLIEKKTFCESVKYLKYENVVNILQRNFSYEYNNEELLEVYPTILTSTEQITISAKENIKNVHFFNCQGKLLFSVKYDNPYNSLQLKVSQYLKEERLNGLYLLIIQTENLSYTKKIVFIH